MGKPEPPSLKSWGRLSGLEPISPVSSGEEEGDAVIGESI